jgi:hypothetical protein
MSTEEDLEAKRKLFERRLQAVHPTWNVTIAWVAELPPYKFAVWVTDLKPVHVVFDANEIVALGTASDDVWFTTFNRKLSQALAEELIVK